MTTTNMKAFRTYHKNRWHQIVVGDIKYEYRIFAHILNHKEFEVGRFNVWINKMDDSDRECERYYLEEAIRDDISHSIKLFDIANSLDLGDFIIPLTRRINIKFEIINKNKSLWNKLSELFSVSSLYS